MHFLLPKQRRGIQATRSFGFLKCMQVQGQEATPASFDLKLYGPMRGLTLLSDITSGLTRAANQVLP